MSCRRVADAAHGVLGREAIVWERSAGAAALTAGIDLRKNAQALQAEAARRLPGAVISIGVGRVQPDPLELQLSYAKALRSLQIGRRGGGQGVVSLLADLGLDRLLMSCAATQLEDFFTATLDPMPSYERAHPLCGYPRHFRHFWRPTRT